MTSNVKLLSTHRRRPNIVFRGRQRFTVNKYNVQCSTTPFYVNKCEQEDMIIIKKARES